MLARFAGVLLTVAGIWSGLPAPAQIVPFIRTGCVAAPPDLVAWWRAEGNASDVVGGQSGQLMNNVSFAPGRVGQAFAFDGSSYVEVPDAPSLRLERELTIEFWVRRERWDQPHYIVEKGGDWTRGQQNYAVALHTGAYNHCLHFLFAGGWRGGGSIADTNWHHCAVVARDGDIDPVLYIDGASQPIVYGEGAPTIRLNPSTRPLHLGAQIDPQSGWFYYHQGMVDELSLYNRALSAQEIEAVYRAGSHGKCAPGAPPTIVTQPVSQTRFVGQSVTFSVGASGTPPLRYQWMLDGSGIAGAINASLVLTNVRASDAGRYRVMISNTTGSAASIDAILTVLPGRPDSYCASSPDGTFSTALDPDEWSDVQALAAQADGRILAGGTVRAGVCGLVRFNIDGSRDTRFAPLLTGNIFALAVQPDGRLVVGGEFDLPGGGPFGLARLNVDGSLDVTFAPGSIDEYGPVLAVTLLSNGQVLAGGRFGQFGGVRGNRVVRVNSDGSRDTTFDADSAEFCGGVQALLAQADGRVLLGLESWNCPASTRRGLVRLNADGSLDPTFSADIREPVQRLVAQPDGRFLAAGDFVAVNGLVRPRLVRLSADGALDESFVFAGAPFNFVSALTLLPDGRIVAGGEFMDDSWRQTVVVLGTNGSRDPNFQALFDYEDNDPAVWTLAVQPDGQLLVGGEFGDVNGTSQFLVARLQGRSQNCPGFLSFGAARFYCGETDGSLTLTLHRSEGATGQLAVNYATVNGEALAGADYQRQTGTVVFAEGQTEHTITVPLLDDTLREANERFAVQVTAGTNSQPFLDGQPLKATVVIVDDENAARPGSVDRTFFASIPVSFRGGTPVTGAVLQPDGKILFGGDFEVINGTSRPHLARLMADGSIDTSFDAPLVRHGPVLALAVQPDGRILVGGWFSPAGIARLLPDGQADSSFDPGTGVGPWITVSVILLQPDGKVMIGGQFSSVDGHPRQSIARLNADGSVDTEFAATGATWAVGGAAYVWALALQADGKVVLGGAFEQVNGQARTSLARLNADGSLDATFQSPLTTNAYVTYVDALVVAPDGKLLMGGSFIVSGLQHRNLVRLNPDGSVDQTFQAYTDGQRYSAVQDIALQPDGKLVVAGSFQFINGVSQPYLARLNPDGSSDRDFFIGAGPNGSVGSVQVQPDGQVLVTGHFATFDNLPHPYLVRLNGDSPPVAPTITQQPESITRYLGETASFSVIAAGTPPLTYQWWFNGQALPDAVSATLTLPNVRPAQAGTYWVRVSNSVGAATSAVVTLTVSDGTNCVAAPPGLVAWWRAEGNASDVVGGQSGQLINNVSFASGRVGQAFAFDGRSYVEVSDASSLRLERALTIEFWVRRERFDQPHYIVEKGGDWTWGQQNYAVALHTGAYNHCLHFLFAGGWRGGGSIADTNWHHCAVVARNGDTDPVLYIDGASQPIVYGEGAPTIRLNPSTRPLHIGAQIDPQSGWFYYHQGLVDELSLYNRALSAQEIEGIYRAGSSGKCATSTPPTLVTLPVSQTRFVGQSVTFRVGASGAPPLSYRWLFDGATIPGATNATLTLSNLQPEQAGSYAVRISNTAGSITSGAATLTVLPRPTGPGSLDLTFDPTAGGERVGLTGGSPIVHSVLPQPDGKVLIGGWFNGVNGVLRNNVARLNADGSLDPGFQPGLAAVGAVTSLALQADGKVIIILGSASDYSAQPHPLIVRLNVDGSVDDTFNCRLAGDANLRLTGVAVQSSGKIWIGGQFTNVNGVARLNLARLNADGSLDAGFDPQALIPGTNRYVEDLHLQPDDKLLVAGPWSDPPRSLIRLNADGTSDAGFANVVVSDPFEFYGLGQIRDISCNGDGAIGIAGYFSAVNGVPRRHVARLNPDGTVDTRFDPGAGPDFSLLRAVVVQADGKVVIGGVFHLVNGFDRQGLARLNANGSVDTDFDPANAAGVPPGYHASIYALALQSNGALLVGAAEWWQQDNTNSVFRLSVTGQREPEFAALLQAPVEGISTFVRQPDGKVILSVSGIYTRPALLRLHPNGLLDESFVSGTNFGVIWALALQPDGRILVAASPEAELQPAAVVRLQSDGRVDASFGSPAIFGGEAPVETLTLQPDGKILVGGLIWEIGGLPYQGLARLHPNGDLDTSFRRVPISVTDDPGYGVSHIVVLPAGKILIAGGFRWDTGEEAGIALLQPDGTVDPAFEANAAHAMYVYAAALQPDGKIILSGYFPDAGVGVIRLNPDGTHDSTFQPAIAGEFFAVALQPDGRILLATGWVQSNSSQEGRIVRLNPEGSLDPTLQTALDSWGARTMILQPDGQVLVAGFFHSVNGIPMHGIARLNNDVVQSFVRRAIHRPLIQLVATPPTNVSAYAVEDQVQPTAVIASISHGGVFDEVTGKVKFGPFYDHEPRTLSYSVLIPPGCIHGVCGLFTFAGTASADGVNTPIAGDAVMLVAGLHPADLASADSQLSIGEVTAYGAAWRRGETWPVPPVPIPIDYVTRAAFLWRGGECYQVDPVATNAPLCWVNCGAPRGADFQSAVSQVSNLPAAQRQMANAFVPGEPLVITVSVSAASARAYALEEQFPAGWTVASISDGGELDASGGKVKWGPFLDNTPRSLSYQATPPATADRAVSFAGVASFDGTSQVLAGACQLREGCRVSMVMPTRPGRFELTLSGRPGVNLILEASSDLVTWTALGEVTTGTAPVPFVDPAAAQFPQRFYRAREER